MGNADSSDRNNDISSNSNNDSENSLFNSNNIISINNTLKSSAKSSAVDSLRDSKKVANEMARDIVYTFLKEKSSQGKFGDLLQSIFAYESTLYPTRWLIYWSLGLDYTKKNIEYQVCSCSDCIPYLLYDLHF